MTEIAKLSLTEIMDIAMNIPIPDTADTAREKVAGHNQSPPQTSLRSMAQESAEQTESSR